LKAEIDTLRGKSREQAMLIDRLQRRLGNGYVLAPPAKSAETSSAEAEIDGAQRGLAEAEAAVQSVRAVAAGDTDEGRAAFEREIRALNARGEDQAGEIARLKAALVAFEQDGSKGGGLKDSKIALKARLGSAQAQADQQTATIARLRAELAATHERLARQAAHFMNEMRRVGGGAVPPTVPSRRSNGAGPRTLSERVAQIRGERTVTGTPRVPESRRIEPPAANGHNGKNQAETAKADEPGPAETEVNRTAAAEMPQAPEIPEKRRRPRLLDRITGLSKSS
jgi:hypothetical protein